MPAVEQAIYQAELAACAAQQHGVAAGAIGYATNNRRRYPYRAGTNEANTGNYFALHLSLPFGLHNKGNVFGYDDRPLLRPYVNINAMADPLTRGVDLDSSPPDTMVFASYNLWFGWYWLSPAGKPNRAMSRLGDGIGFDGNTYHAMLGDTHGHWAFGSIWDAHPDRDGVWAQHVQQDEPWGGSNPAEQKVTVSLWTGSVFTAQPGPFDLNFAFEDGSTRRYDDVHWNIDDEAREDRFDRVPNYHRSDDLNYWQAIPRER